MRRVGDRRVLVYWFLALQAGLLAFAALRDQLEALIAPGATAILALSTCALAQVYLVVKLPDVRTRTLFAMNYALCLVPIVLEYVALELFGYRFRLGKVFEGDAIYRLGFVALELAFWVVVAGILTAIALGARLAFVRR